jgi:hypothetical protein
VSSLCGVRSYLSADPARTAHDEKRNALPQRNLQEKIKPPDSLPPPPLLAKPPVRRRHQTDRRAADALEDQPCLRTAERRAAHAETGDLIVEHQRRPDARSPRASPLFQIARRRRHRSRHEPRIRPRGRGNPNRAMLRRGARATRKCGLHRRHTGAWFVVCTHRLLCRWITQSVRIRSRCLRSGRLRPNHGAPWTGGYGR